MAVELQALGVDDSQCSVRSLETNDVFQLGRAPQNDWVVDWDRLISREHAQMRWHDGQLQVRCMEKATNPVIINGESFRELKIDVGGEFLIGATNFRLIGEVESQEPSGMDMSEDEPLAGLQTYQSDELSEFQFRVSQVFSSRKFASRGEFAMLRTPAAHLCEHPPFGVLRSFLGLMGCDLVPCGIHARP